MDRTRVVQLRSWEEFLDEISRRRTGAADSPPTADGVLSDLLFRGQEDATWELETTLERYLRCEKTNVLEYFRVLSAVARRVESATARRWDLPTLNDYERAWTGAKGFPRADFPAYEFMAYARHHGFPSPLLDWTHSPYIAAYFAYAFSSQPPGGSVAIYVYREYGGSVKMTKGGTPQIRELGPYVRTHPRHFLQQSQYTVCWQRDDSGAYYCRHDLVFGEKRGRQDLLWKYELPASEADRVLSELDLSNLNAYSLFGSEDSLFHTLAFRELRDLRET